MDRSVPGLQRCRAGRPRGRYDLAMVRTSYLRVYRPLGSFPPDEAAHWTSDAGGHTRGELKASRRWLLGGRLPDDGGTAAWGGAFMREVDGRVLVCPALTRLRMLSALVEFRRSVPDEVVDAFVPGDEARRADVELEALGRRHPDMRSHILHANWYVPLRWFVAFDATERILTEDSAGLRVRYETTLMQARARLARALDVLAHGSDDAIVDAVRELDAWLEGFPGDGLLELDYGTVAQLVPDDVLVDDCSAAEVWSSIEALEAGDVVAAGRLFGRLSERWAEVRAREAVN